MKLTVIMGCLVLGEIDCKNGFISLDEIDCNNGMFSFR